MNDRTVREILVIEDEPMIALEVETAVREAGFEAVTIVHSVASALRAIDDRVVHAAILDANLRGESAAPVAARLRARRIPFIVVTGQSANEVGDWLEDARVVAKPFSMRKLVETIMAVAEGTVESRSPEA